VETIEKESAVDTVFVGFKAERGLKRALTASAAANNRALSGVIRYALGVYLRFVGAERQTGGESK
jgi:hypothetical protein